MKPLVGIIMGSTSDWETMRAAAEALDKLGVPYETRVVSAHRTPDLLFEYASAAQARGIEVIVAGAGGAAHLPGMVASKTTLPVLGVPVQSKALNGLDSLLSIVQMPAGIPVATFAIGRRDRCHDQQFQPGRSLEPGTRASDPREGRVVRGRAPAGAIGAHRIARPAPRLRQAVRRRRHARRRPHRPAQWSGPRSPRSRLRRRQRVVRAGCSRRRGDVATGRRHLAGGVAARSLAEAIRKTTDFTRASSARHLAAVTIWRGLAAESAIGLPGPPGVSAKTLRLLQEAADHTAVRGSRAQEFAGPQ